MTTSYTLGDGAFAVFGIAPALYAMRASKTGYHTYETEPLAVK